jgi:hypothetical protein
MSGKLKVLYTSGQSCPIFLLALNRRQQKILRPDPPMSQRNVQLLLDFVIFVYILSFVSKIGSQYDGKKGWLGRSKFRAHSKRQTALNYNRQLAIIVAHYPVSVTAEGRRHPSTSPTG